jgi:hypothetical protein
VHAYAPISIIIRCPASPQSALDNRLTQSRADQIAEYSLLFRVGLSAPVRAQISRLAIFGREVVDVWVKFSGGAGQAGLGGVVIDVPGDGG